VHHSRLRFRSIGEAWRHVSTHFDECQLPSGRAKCYVKIPLYKEINPDLFRPESLRFDARGYNYDPLMSVKKVGSTWKVVIKGADEPNRAMVILDENFTFVKIARLAAPR
jgi:hypothetical protein